MNIEQQKVAEHIYGPAAVLAGAGSGKTTTLINRITELIKVTKPDRIVMLTFTNAAADEMKYKASKVNEDCKNVIACTYHKFCGKMLRKYGKAIGIDPSFEILVAKKYQTLIEYVKSSNEYYENLKDFPSASKLDTIFSTVTNNEDITIERMIWGTKYKNYAQDIKNLYNEVKQYGLENHKLNFDDMLVYMNELLNNDAICKKIAESYDFMMVDEFQDTNALQLSILLKLSKYNRNIVVVGDISQSIYKFRGAKVENIENFIDAFSDCAKYTLSVNYRSTGQILDAVNDIMSKNVRSWEYTYMIETKEGNKPVLINHYDDSKQIDWILAKIKQSVGLGYSLRDIAIIERKSMSSFKLENALLKEKIPFKKRGGRKFTDYVCVDDMLSFLSILLKNDKFNWFNILQLIPGIGSKTATEIANHCKEKNFLEKYKKRKFNDRLLELQSNLQKFDVTDLNNLFDEVSKYYFSLREYKIVNSKLSSSAKFDAMENIARDKEIVAILKDMAHSYNNLKSFLEDIALDTLKTENDDQDQLLITTIHGAKGLEWPIVIIIDAVETEMTDDEEELRCLYVAMTRAETDLTISIPRYSILNGTTVRNEFIRFVRDSEDYFEEIRD